VKTAYTPDSLLSDPDPCFLALNNELIVFDTEVSTYIPASQYPLITRGLASLMDIHLFQISKRITSMNSNGCELMQLNILVLQQNLKNIEPNAELRYSALFFDLFTAGAEAVVQRAKSEGKGFGLGDSAIAAELFGYDTVKGLVELCYSEKLGSERREVGVQAKRQLDTHLLEISEALY
jgi:exocyst complex component 4